MDSKSEDQLWSYFEKSAHRVRQVFKWFEQNCISPSIKFGEASFKKYPAATTFLTIFALLSSLPILSFIGFSIFLFTSTIFVALFLALIVSAVITASISSLLAGVLLLLAIISTLLSAIVISIYLFARLFILVRADGKLGWSGWSNETKLRFFHGELQKEERGRSRPSGPPGAVKNDPKLVRSEILEDDDVKHNAM